MSKKLGKRRRKRDNAACLRSELLGIIGGDTYKNKRRIIMAIKGAARQMIVLRCGDSEMFETAYFVVKPGCRGRGRGGDMLREANRIVEANSFPAKAGKAVFLRRKRGVIFALGALSGGGAVGGIWLVLSLLL